MRCAACRCSARTRPHAPAHARFTACSPAPSGPLGRQRVLRALCLNSPQVLCHSGCFRIEDFRTDPMKAGPVLLLP